MRAKSHAFTTVKFYDASRKMRKFTSARSENDNLHAKKSMSFYISYYYNLFLCVRAVKLLTIKVRGASGIVRVSGQFFRFLRQRSVFHLTDFNNKWKKKY